MIHEFVIRLSIAILGASILLTSYANAEQLPNRETILKRIQRACEKNIRRPKILKDRLSFCTCIVRNHGSSTKTQELPLIERIYNKAIKLEESATVSESIVADFDIDVANSCLADSTYNVKK